MSFFWSPTCKAMFKYVANRSGVLQRQITKSQDQSAIAALIRAGYLAHGTHPTETARDGGRASTLHATDLGRKAFANLDG